MIVRRAKSLREKKELGREITLHRTPRRGRLAPKLVPMLKKNEMWYSFSAGQSATLSSFRVLLFRVGKYVSFVSVYHFVCVFFFPLLVFRLDVGCD